MSIAMKAIALLFLPALPIVSACGGTSPVNSDPKDNAGAVDRSRREGTVVISLDTIFDAGVPYAVIRSAPVVLPGRLNGVGADIHALSVARMISTVPVVLYGDHYVSYRFDDGRYIDTAYIGYHESMLEDARTIVRAGLLARDSINQPQARVRSAACEASVSRASPWRDGHARQIADDHDTREGGLAERRPDRLVRLDGIHSLGTVVWFLVNQSYL